MHKRKIDWNRVLESLEYHLSNYLTGEKQLKEAGKEGIRTEITIHPELGEVVWGTGQHYVFNRDEFRLFVELDAKKAIDFVKAKLDE